MSITKRSFLLYLTLITVLAGAMGTLVLHNLTGGHYFENYPLIPTYFFLYGVFSIYAFDACRRHAPQKMVLLFLALKVMKFILSIFLLVVYCMVVPDSAVTFLLTFVAFYLVYLMYESWFFFVYEWKKKLKKR